MRDRAALAEALRDRPAARMADARDRQRHLLCHAGGLPVAPAAKRPAEERFSSRTSFYGRSFTLLRKSILVQLLIVLQDFPLWRKPMTTPVTLEAVEAFMAERRATLAFPDWLQRNFEADRRTRRCRMLSANTKELIVVYNLFLAADWFLTPDTWSITAFLHLAIITPWMLGALWLFGQAPAAGRRELIAASLPILISLQVLLIYALSRSPGAVYYQNLVLLVILYASAIQRLPYRLATAVSCFVIAIHAGSVFATGALPLAAACLSSHGGRQCLYNVGGKPGPRAR